MRKIRIDLIIILLLAVISVVFVRVYSTGRGTPGQLSIIPESGADSSATTIQYIYGIPIDSFSVGGAKVRNDEVLAGILFKLGLTGEQSTSALEKAGKIFDVRKLKAGNRYFTFSSFDSIPRLKYFVYEKDAVNYLVLSFNDTIAAWNGIKQIDTIRNTFAGRISTSLWNTFSDQGANPMMANELSEIYAWTIDFFGLQENDSLRVIYDEYYVDSVSVGIGTIYGAWFRHSGQDFWAIPFVQDSVRSFFDDEGASLRKAFLKAPLRFSRISSRFSNSRMHPILKIRRPHYGVDYAAPVGTPVYSIGDGTITETSYSQGAGNMVRIRHNSVYSTTYMHLSKYASGVQKGSFVRQGDVIGFVGSTGLSTGPHLDFRFYKNGSPVDPLKVEAPSVEPVSQKNIEEFNGLKIRVMEELRF